MEDKVQEVSTTKKKLARGTRSAMLFALTWGLLFGAASIIRSGDAVNWQDLLVVAVYGISAVLYFVAVYMFWKEKIRIGKLLSYLGYFPGLIIGSSVQGGGASILILVVTGSAFSLMFAFMVEEKRQRNRFLLYSLGVLAFSLVLYFIPFPFRYVVEGSDSTGAGIPITIATALVAALLIITQGREGIRLFRRSTGFKLGVAFSLTTLITLGFMVFAITTLTRVSVDFDYTRYADLEQIFVNELKAEVRGMRVHLYEYLRYYGSEGLDEAYANYMGEYQSHYANATALFDEVDSLYNAGWGFYIPGEESEAKLADLSSIEANTLQFNSLAEQLVGLISQRGYKDQGLEGEFRLAVQELESSAAFRQNPDLQVLLLQMRRHEKDWIIRQETDDAEAVNSYGAQAIAMLRSADITAGERLSSERNINTYLDKFNQVVELDQQIAGVLFEIEQTFAPINPTLQNLAVLAEAETEASQTSISATEGYVRNAAIAFGIGAVLAAGAVAFMTTRIIVRPVTALTGTASALAEGNLDARAEVTTQDEVGTLATVFNQMAERLQSTLAGLEETINERTAQLQERAREMEASQRVTFAASERTSPEDFLDLLVNLIADQFDVYHCQVYLVDEATNRAVLTTSTGYAGRQLLQRGHFIPLDAQSLVTRSINTGESVLVADTASDPNWLPNQLLPLTKSELVVPLKVDDQVIGALDIQDRTAGRFGEASVPVFESMTEQVAFLYQNNELLEDIAEAQRIQQEFVQQLEAASEVAGQLTTILDPTQLLDQAVTMVQSRFDFYHAHIYLLDETRQNLVVQSGSGHVGVILKERKHSIPVTAEKSFVATAYRNATPVRVADTTEDPNWLPNPLLPDTRAEMAVPLITRGQVIGVLDIQDEEVGRFTEVDEDTMLTLAGQLATSVDTARLFVDVERAAERDRTRFEIANALAGNLTEDQVWDILMEKAEGENLSVTFSLTEHLPDGDIQLTTHRSQSTDPAISPAPMGEKFLISENPVLAYLKPGEMFVSNNIATDERANPEIREYLASQGLVSMMAAPLAVAEGDTWQGLIRVSSSKAGFFDADVTSMYDALIETGTVALQAARLRAESAAREERFRALFNYSPDAVLVLDFATGLWSDANTNAAEMFGLSHDELMKTGPAQLSPSYQPNGRESGEYAVERINEAIESGTNQFEWVHKDANDREFVCEIRLAVLPGGGTDLLVNITDISERKAAQQAIVQGDRLKSEFLANMSHELRTPLNSILGYTDVLLMGLDGELEEEVVTDLEAIHDNSQHLLNLINDILDLAKIEAGRMTIELSDVNVSQLLAEVKKTSAGLLVNKDVEMEIEVDEQLPVMLADYHRVYQVVNNLVSNAVKFTEEGTITLRAYAGENQMVLQVADTGIGISAEDLEAIFEEFTQADTSSTRQHEGTGLGLTITRRLVQMHGGTISVESEPGKGSTFTVHFPLQAKVNPDLLVVRQSSNGNR